VAISKFLAERKLSLKFAHVYHAEIITSYAASLKKREALWAVAKPIAPSRLARLPPRSHQPRLLLRCRLKKHVSALSQAAPPQPRLVIPVAALVLLLPLPLHVHSLQVRYISNDERPTQQYKIGHGKASRRCICSLYSKLTRTSIAASPDQRLLKESDQTKAANRPDRMLKGLSKQN
jgi:hypothetical protein